MSGVPPSCLLVEGSNLNARKKSLIPFPLSSSQALCGSRLSVCTYNATTVLEILVSNFPTIIFWNPTLFELRDSAQPYYDELRKASILHDTPESAAIKVNEV